MRKLYFIGYPRLRISGGDDGNVDHRWRRGAEYGRSPIHRRSAALISIRQPIHYPGTFFACFLTFAQRFFAAFTIAALPAGRKGLVSSLRQLHVPQNAPALVQRPVLRLVCAVTCPSVRSAGDPYVQEFGKIFATALLCLPLYVRNIDVR